MTVRRVPIIPTIIVLAAVATMIGLGIWQLGRRAEKEVLLARYEAAAGSSETVGFPLGGAGEAVLFRRSALTCLGAERIEAVSGTSATGQKGWVQRAWCIVSDDATVPVDLGYTRDIAAPAFTGGTVSGIIAPGPRLVADPPLAGLQPMAKPDPGDLPNNHLAYAGQWFFFALTALVIYVLALRRRRR
ncbi:SURF1 family cytochrome oxidase biogenesis protein [Erythrobacter donghaensis]|uniref:SURF1 family cytochrome oxidase biogenesis protein n=1 Tax=Erythrobacter donghaensis TaxID=267135 RepID=UPI000A39D118|nr:SURF1 family cytochrome oxidase biogenesis protein [Erythrobacter donghaensis]